VIKRFLVALAASAVALVAMVGVEVVLAMRREYLPTEPAFAIGGEFGPPDGRPLRFVVLGDSTAAGLGAGDPSGSYAAALARKLGDDGWRVEMTGLGVSGARVKDVADNQAPDVAALDPDLVFVGIGANDTTHWTPLDEVERDMRRAIETLEATGATVVVAGAPDMRAAAFHEPLRSIVGWRGRAVAAAIARAADAEDVPVVPLARLTYPFFEAAPDTHNSPDMFHPSAVGYARWADAIYPYLREALARR